MTVYKDVNMKPVLSGRVARRTRLEAGDAKQLQFSHLVYLSGGLKVVKVYADKYGVGWIWDDRQQCYLRASIYLPLIQLIKRDDGDI